MLKNSDELKQDRQEIEMFIGDVNTHTGCLVDIGERAW